MTDGTHVTAGQLALTLTPYAQVTELAVNTAAAGNNAAAIQSLDDRVTAELASKLDSSAGHGGGPGTTDGQVAAHGSSIAALQSSLTTGLSNKADQSAFDVLEGVVATKSTPDGEDHAAGGGHQGGQRSPGGRHRRGRAREQRRLHLGPAGLQGGRQRADRLRPAVGRGHFLGGG